MTIFQRKSTRLFLLFTLLALVGNWAYLKSEQDSGIKAVTLYPVAVKDAAALEKLFAHYQYDWPPQEGVPPLELESLPRDLGTLPVAEKKALFLQGLLPLVLAENRRILEQRQFLQQQLAWQMLGVDAKQWERMQAIANAYKVKGDLNDATVQEELLRKVDMVPVSLVLAQAANESGWGTSRFALEGNSLFGQWTFREGTGLKPEEAHPETRHAVKAYPNLRASVRGYLHNLNSGFAYKDLRDLRAQLRHEGRPLDGLLLANELHRYSQRGEEYVEEIRTMIQSNHLLSLRGITLEKEAPPPASLLANNP